MTHHETHSLPSRGPYRLPDAPFQEPEDLNYYTQFLSLPEVKQAIHVGNHTFNDGEEVEKYLREDTVKSVKPWLTEIVNNYKVRVPELFSPTVGASQGPQENPLPLLVI